MMSKPKQQKEFKSFLIINKQIALLISVVLFTMAMVVTLIGVCFTPRTLKVEIKPRLTIEDKSEVKTFKRVDPQQTIESVLNENGLDLGEEYMSDKNLKLRALEVKEVTLSKIIGGSVEVEGEIKQFESGAATIGDLLNEMGIEVSDSDVVEPEATTPLTQESNRIIIHRVYTRKEEREELIPYAITRIEDPSLETGATVVETPGVDGLKKITENVTYFDGRETGRTLVSVSIPQKVTNQVERIGVDYTNGNGITTVSSAPAEPAAEAAAQPQPTPTEQPQPTRSSSPNIVTTTATWRLPTSYNWTSPSIAGTTVKANGTIDTTSADSYARPVNSANPLPSNYVPSDLVSVDYGDGKMRRDAANAFKLMASAMKNDIGVDLYPISPYRDYGTQGSISSGSGTAGAGYSEHQTGLAVDVGVEGAMNVDYSDHFENTEAYAWLYQHAHEYGFCNSYPYNTNYEVGFEPWHWRFLGADLAPVVKQAQDNGECVQFDDWAANNAYYMP